MKPLILSVVAALAFVGCAHTPSSSTVPTPATTEPKPYVQNIAAALPLIQTGATVATGAVLQFVVSDSDKRTALANEIYAASQAIYSLTGGSVPTPDQLKATVLEFGGSDADAQYAQYASSLSAIYSAYFNTIKGDPALALKVLNAIASGAEAGTKSYLSVK